jgi:ATP-binding cassette subfamily B protein
MMYNRRAIRNGIDGDTKSRVTWPLLKRVLGFARPYWRRLTLSLVLVLMTTALGLVTPLILRDLIDNTLPNGDVDRLNWLALALVIVPIATSIISVISRRNDSAIGEGVIYDLRRYLYAHMQNMSLRFFTNTKTGELLSRLNNDVVAAQTAISDTLVGIVTNSIDLIATLLVMFALEWRLTLLGLVVFPLFVLASRSVGYKLRDIARQAMDDNAYMNAMMSETLNVSGALLVKLFGRQRIEVERFENRASRVRDIGVRRAVVGAQFFALMGLVGVIGTALVYWVGGHLVLDGVFTVGTIVAFSAYLTKLYSPLRYLTSAPVDFATSMVSFERVFEVVDLPVEIVQKPDAQPLTNVRGDLNFENVSFSYTVNDTSLLKDVRRYGRTEDVGAVLSGESRPQAKNGDESQPEKPRSQARAQALTDVSFSLKAGQLAALVGPSGAGKTTMTYLIPRLYDPTSGRITIDGHDLRDLQIDSLAENIGMVTQETYLFHDTIRTNLLYANMDATQEQIEAAARAANIHDFIMGLSEGYDTIVGERGYRLSGGEKQRLAIARVILKDPRILVLDEATSHLDSQSEALIQDALETIMENRTSIVIAHRLSTILAADIILVMDRGQIVERGTHDELMRAGGLYADLYETQFSRQELMRPENPARL